DAVDVAAEPDGQRGQAGRLDRVVGVDAAQPAEAVVIDAEAAGKVAEGGEELVGAVRLVAGRYGRVGGEDELGSDVRDDVVESGAGRDPVGGPVERGERRVGCREVGG